MKKIMIQLTTGANLRGYIHDDLIPKKRRTFLIFPGGGYTYCSKREGEPIACAYEREGYQCFVLEYITNGTENWCEIWESANEAMDELYAKQEEWNVNYNELIVIGFSAGGHLAGTLGASGRRRPQALILCYPVIIESLAKLISPQLQGVDTIIDENTPPTFVFSTYEDHVVPIRNTLRLLQALHEMHIPFETHIFQWGHHGLSLAIEETADDNPQNIDKHAAHWYPLSLEWIERIFKERKKSSKDPTHERVLTIDALVKNDIYQATIYQEFPILKNQEILEALGHFTLQELREKMGYSCIKESKK